MEVSKKTAVNLVWNYGSLALLSVGGLIFNVIIIMFYDDAVLGVFNQAYAYYILLSQFTVLGISNAILKFSSELNTQPEKRKSLLFTGLLTDLVISIVISALIFVVARFVFKGLVATAVCCTVLALPLFSLNKIILSYVNSCDKMRTYAVFQGLRPILIAASLVAFAILKVDGVYVSFCFFITEFVLLIIDFSYLIATKALTVKFDRSAVKKIIDFGIHIMPGNIILEFNTKIDVLCMGWILKDNALVGVYSFAALFAEGFYQLFVVVRRTINPSLAQYRRLEDGGVQKYTDLSNGIKKYMKIFAPVSAAALILGYAAVCMILGKSNYLQALGVIIVFAVSIALNSKAIIFGNFLSQIGLPQKESLTNILAALTNLVFNFILIATFGMMGAAVATAISYFAYSLIQGKYIKDEIKIRI